MSSKTFLDEFEIAVTMAIIMKFMGVLIVIVKCEV